MNKKRIIAVIMSLVMAVGMTLVFTGCGEDESQGEEQAAVPVEETEEPATEETQAAATAEEYIALAGEYQDEVSQRASATVIADPEAQSVNITVMWGSSAWETTMWTMNATKEGNKLVYNDCKRVEMSYSDDSDTEESDNGEFGGGAEETVVYENESGSFDISEDGKLLWTGASDPECQDCVFVMYVE